MPSRARTEGPQRVTVRGKDAVVVIAADALEKLLPAAKPRQSSRCVFARDWPRRNRPGARARSRPRHLAVNGWLLDTNIIAELAEPRGAKRVLAWASARDEALLFLSVLTLGE